MLGSVSFLKAKTFTLSLLHIMLPSVFPTEDSGRASLVHCMNSWIPNFLSINLERRLHGK